MVPSEGPDGLRATAGRARSHVVGTLLLAEVQSPHRLSWLTITIIIARAHSAEIVCRGSREASTRSDID